MARSCAPRRGRVGRQGSDRDRGRRVDGTPGEMPEGLRPLAGCEIAPRGVPATLRRESPGHRRVVPMPVAVTVEELQNSAVHPGGVAGSVDLFRAVDVSGICECTSGALL